MPLLLPLLLLLLRRWRRVKQLHRRLQPALPWWLLTLQLCCPPMLLLTPRRRWTQWERRRRQLTGRRVLATAAMHCARAVRRTLSHAATPRPVLSLWRCRMGAMKLCVENVRSHAESGVLCIRKKGDESTMIR